MINFVEFDYRINNLMLIIESFENTRVKLRKQIEASDWYSNEMYVTELELLLGMIFISLQNYINGTIMDWFPRLKDQHLKYNIGKKEEKNRIELIIALANYYKHKDSSGNLYPNTMKALEYYNLSTDKDADIVNSPILKGFELLSENWKIDNLVDIVKLWRKELWCFDEAKIMKEAINEQA